jgi:hypothetical protein
VFGEVVERVEGRDLVVVRLGEKKEKDGEARSSALTLGTRLRCAPPSLRVQSSGEG